MTRSLLLATLFLGSVSAQAQDASFNLTLTPENNGAGTRFSWSYSGNPTMGTTPLISLIDADGVGFFSGSASQPPYYAITGTPDVAFTTSIPAITSINTGLVLTNTTTLESRNLTTLVFGAMPDPAYIYFGWANASSSLLRISEGEVVVLSGPTSGFFLSDIPFSTFELGSWTLDHSVYLNFDPVLTVGGTPVPEPSTYGLILGGLALAGAAIRRRKAKQA